MKKKSQSFSIDQARSMKDLFEIAVARITAMRRHYGKDCIIEMVCGPLFTGRGTDEERLRRFRAAIRMLRRTNHLVFDQLPFRNALNRLQSYEGQILSCFFKQLFYYLDRLCFLPAWQYSVGARFERKEAKRQRIAIIDIH